MLRWNSTKKDTPHCKGPVVYTWETDYSQAARTLAPETFHIGIAQSPITLFLKISLIILSVVEVTQKNILNMQSGLWNITDTLFHEQLISTLSSEATYKEHIY